MPQRGSNHGETPRGRRGGGAPRGVVALAREAWICVSVRAMPKLLDLTGRTFGRLVVTARAPNHGSATYWETLCTCGRRTNVPGANLRCGMTRSCGCLRAESATRHGMHASPERHCWSGMLSRCSNPKSTGWLRYGGRGITVCARWRQSFVNFFADMGRRPSDEHSIDRKDNDKGYWCGHCDECLSLQRTANCRWATRLEQADNRSNTHHVVIDGEVLTASACVERSGLKRATLRSRLRVGRPAKEAVTDRPDRLARFRSDDDPAVTPWLDITGRRFGRYVALHPAPRRGRHHLYWLARCDCGRTVEVAGSHLRAGRARQCRPCHLGHPPAARSDEASTSSGTGMEPADA